VKEWEATPGLYYSKNCVFIDEAIYAPIRSDLERNPTKATMPAAKGITTTILGAISPAGVIGISLKKPQAVNGRFGTVTEHFLAYVSNVMDVLDTNNRKRY
ncbi:hypothetical protein BC943DRAFT_279263, partial [Umbelopsis sp. AD052]